MTRDICFRIYVEVDGPEHFTLNEDLCDAVIVLYDILVQRHIRNPHIIFARVPSGRPESYLKLREWIMVLCEQALELGSAPAFTYMLIDIPEDTIAHEFPACCSIRTNAFPMDPEMCTARYEWLLSVETAVRDSMNTSISAERWTQIQSLVSNSAFSQTSANVYWKYSLQPLLAFNAVNGLTWKPKYTGALTGKLRTSCNMPYTYRFPKVVNTISAAEPHGLTINSLTDMVNRFQKLVKEPTLRARFDVVEMLITQQRRFF